MRILTLIKRSPVKRLLYENHGHLRIEAFHILIMHGIKAGKSLLMTTAFILEVIWLRGGVRRRVLHVSYSSAETEYKAIAHTACEMMWLKSLL